MDGTKPGKNKPRVEIHVTEEERRREPWKKLRERAGVKITDTARSVPR